MDRLQVSVRPATIADTHVIVQFLRHMLSELASMGDHPMSQDQEQWTRVLSETKEALDKPDCLHLLAEAAGPITAGWAYARIADLDAIYEPARVLHISALYVTKAYRHKGIGRALLLALLEWGQNSGCVEAELNVLADNPARSLYEKLGFGAFRIKMSRKL